MPAVTARGMPYPLPTEPVAEGAQAIRNLAEAVAPALVSTLPASPYDGQEVFYLADAAAGVVWHLCYRAASPSAYKWEFVGGASLFQLYRPRSVDQLGHLWLLCAASLGHGAEGGRIPH